MIDISIVARKAIPDPYAPLEFGDPGAPRDAGKAPLSDSQSTFLGQFIIAHLPRKSHDAFRRAVLNRLTAGMPGTAASDATCRRRIRIFTGTVVISWLGTFARPCGIVEAGWSRQT